MLTRGPSGPGIPGGPPSPGKPYIIMFIQCVVYFIVQENLQVAQNTLLIFLTSVPGGPGLPLGPWFPALPCMDNIGRKVQSSIHGI